MRNKASLQFFCLRATKPEVVLTKYSSSSATPHGERLEEVGDVKNGRDLSSEVRNASGGFPYVCVSDIWETYHNSGQQASAKPSGISQSHMRLELKAAFEESP